MSKYDTVILRLAKRRCEHRLLNKTCCAIQAVQFLVTASNGPSQTWPSSWGFESQHHYRCLWVQFAASPIRRSTICVFFWDFTEDAGGNPNEFPPETSWWLLATQGRFISKSLFWDGGRLHTSPWHSFQNPIKGLNLSFSWRNIYIYMYICRNSMVSSHCPLTDYHLLAEKCQGKREPSDLFHLNPRKV